VLREKRVLPVERKLCVGAAYHLLVLDSLKCAVREIHLALSLFFLRQSVSKVNLHFPQTCIRYVLKNSVLHYSVSEHAVLIISL
jgi:hypothetical protein